MSIPNECQVCERPFVGVHYDGAGVYYDAKTKYGPWGFLCEKCFKEHGVGLGTGKGQKYDARTGRKLEG
jgi:hypothetical protein